MPGSRKLPALKKPRGKSPLDGLQPFQIVIANRSEARKYLSRHKILAGALVGICASARTRFGEDAELALELYKDPEADDEYLTLYVRRAHYDAGIMDQIEAIAAGYQSDLDRASGHLLITTDFRRPGRCDVV